MGDHLRGTSRQTENMTQTCTHTHTPSESDNCYPQKEGGTTLRALLLDCLCITWPLRRISLDLGRSSHCEGEGPTLEEHQGPSASTIGASHFVAWTAHLWSILQTAMLEPLVHVRTSLRTLHVPHPLSTLRLSFSLLNLA